MTRPMAEHRHLPPRPGTVNPRQTSLSGAANNGIGCTRRIAQMTIRLHRGDLPDLSRYTGSAVAIDTETMGLDPRRDRLCVVQLSPGDGSADVVQVPPEAPAAPNLTKLLADADVLKIFHFARFDL